MPIANIGTDRLVSTQYPYISPGTDPPYQTTETHSGVIYYDEKTHEEVTQRNDRYTSVYAWTRREIEEYPPRRGVLDRRDRNGLKLSFFRVGETREALEAEVEEDPYYTVT